MKRHILDNTGIIKIGTDAITNSDDVLDRQHIGRLVHQIMHIRERFSRLLIVTSGAMAAGRAELHCAKRDDESVPDRQMFAAIGQVPLMDAYRHFFSMEGALCGQILLTRRDFTVPSSYRNGRATLNAILDRGVIPVVNENDTVATEELTMGDNDQLAGTLARMVHAKVLVLLTSVNGLLRDIHDSSSVIDQVDPLSEEWLQYIQEEKSGNGTGGMKSKCCVASKAARKGTNAYILNGKTPRILERRFIDGEDLGTWFPAVD